MITRNRMHKTCETYVSDARRTPSPSFSEPLEIEGKLRLRTLLDTSLSKYEITSLQRNDGCYQFRQYEKQPDYTPIPSPVTSVCGPRSSQAYTFPERRLALSSESSLRVTIGSISSETAWNIMCASRV